MSDNSSTKGSKAEYPNVDRWPESRDEEVEVLLLGTAHLAHPDFDDVFDRTRQQEFDDLVERLGAWNPDGVAVEREPDQREELDTKHEEYQSGDRTYGRESGADSNSPTDEITLKDTEVVQIGFRLADRRNHDRVYPVDYHMTMDAHLDDDLDVAGFEEMKETAFSSLDVAVPEIPRSEMVDRWQRSTVTEFHEWHNREVNLIANEQTHFAVALEGMNQRYAGAELLTGWYERNLRIVENLWEVASQEDLERLVLVMGQGHSHILRHLLANAPPLCPVDPRPLLTD